MIDASKFRGIAGKLKENEKLASYLAYRIGGPADLFVEPAQESDISQVFEICQRFSWPLLTVGSGTNLLMRDGGYRGVVLFLGAGLPGDLTIVSEDKKSVVIRVPSHWPKAKLLDLALEKGWSGLEFSAGIPGTLGGAVYMNAGTKWGSYGDIIDRVKLFSCEHGFFEKTRDEMQFKYRGHGEGLLDGKTVVVSTDLRLSKERSVKESRALVDEILTYRGSKQPLELPNCGSVFKNPANSEKGAGRWIEACGLKGFRRGQAMISKKHANFILNLGGAKSSDVEEIISQVQKTVSEKFGIQLETEVICVGSVCAAVET